MLIVCFAPTSWFGLCQRHKQLMARLAKRGHKIVYVEPVTFSEIKNIIPYGLFNKTQQVDSVIVTKLLILPFLHRFKVLQKVQKLIASRQVIKILSKIGEQTVDILWISAPYFHFAVSGFPYKLLVYDCNDEYEGFHADSRMRQLLIAGEKTLLKSANVVFATSDRLYKRCISLNKNTRYASNGVPSYFFMQRDVKVEGYLDKIKRPTIGFVGSIAEWLDFDLLYNGACQNSSFSFVFVGPITTRDPKIDALKKLDNVYFLGQVSHHEVPKYIDKLDVCLIPFKVKNFTLSVNPNKLFEYFALGKPVVTTKLDEVMKFGNLVYTCDKDNYSEKLMIALCEGSLLSKEREEVARRFTWNKIVDYIESLLVSQISALK